MSWIFEPVFIQFIGVLIVVLALVQVLLAAVATLNRASNDGTTRALSLQLLKYQSEEALSRFRHQADETEFAWNGFRKFRIDRKMKEVDGIHSFYLVPHDEKSLPPFLPGQFLTFQLKIPGHDKPLIRCYSLSDGPTKDYYRVSIKKIPPPRDQPDGLPGRSSTYFNDVLNEGDIVDAKAPSGHFHLQPDRDRGIVLIGGGIGLTPVVSMLNTLSAEHHKGDVWFFYGVRNSLEHAMKEHLEEMARKHENFNIIICYSEPLETDVEGQDYQKAGYVSVDLFKELLPSNNYVFYICGPPPMMESVTRSLGDWGVPEKDVHFEAFGQAPVKKSPKVEVAPPDGKNDSSVEICFDRSGKTLKWQDSVGSLLDLAEENGINMDFACRSGNCGTCITAIKEGKVDYLVEPGHQPDDGSCLTCVAIPNGKLVLDA